MSTAGRHRRPTARSARRRASGVAAVRRGIRSSRSMSSIARQRTRGPNTPWPAALAQAGRRRPAARGSAGRATLWWISTLGSRSARSDGSLDGERIAGQRQARAGPRRPAAPSSTACPVRRRCRRRAGRRAPGACVIVAHASGTAPTWYWRNTLKARTSTGCRPGQFETAEGELDAARRLPPRRGGVHPLGVDLQPDARARPARTVRSRAASSSVVTGSAPVAEVDHQRIGGGEQRRAHRGGSWTSQRSLRRNRL